MLVKAGAPAGAENRVVNGTGQQGLKPGVGGRQQQQPVRYADKPTPAQAA
jgi:hypothetical protein